LPVISQILKINPFGLDWQLAILTRPLLIPDKCSPFVKHFTLGIKKLLVNKTEVKLRDGAFSQSIELHTKKIFQNEIYHRKIQNPIGAPTRRPFHFIFAIDVSFSMSGVRDAKPKESYLISKFNNRYGAVLQACIDFIKTRVDLVDDLYTCFCHDTSLQHVFTEQRNVGSSLEIMFLNYQPTWGGNCFEHVFEELNNTAATFTSFLTHQQVIIFIGDGGDSFTDTKLALQQLVVSKRCFVCPVIIGSNNDGKKEMQNIAVLANKYCLAALGVEGGQFMSAKLDLKSITALFKSISTKFA